MPDGTIARAPRAGRVPLRGAQSCKPGDMRRPVLRGGVLRILRGPARDPGNPTDAPATRRNLARCTLTAPRGTGPILPVVAARFATARA